MRSKALHSEPSGCFLRSNGSPSPHSCPMPEEGCPPVCYSSTLSSPEDLTPFLHQDPCPAFCLLAIHMDGVDTRFPGFLTDMLGSLQEEAPRILTPCHEHNILFLLLPEASPEIAEKLFSRIQAQRTEAPVNAGLFHHPFPGFPPAVALACAKKALTHSLLLGQGHLTPFDALSLHISGDEAYQEGRIQDAITEYEASLTLAPGNANVLNSLGVCFGALQDFDKALEILKKSFETEPREGIALYNQGLIHEMQRDGERACASFEKVLTLNPESFEAAFHLGKSLMGLQKIPESLEVLSRASSLRPENGPTLGLLAEGHLLHGDLSKAFTLFRQALRRMPRDAAILSGLGACFDAKGENPDIAATFCEEALSLEPENGLFALRLARIRLRQDRPGEAERLFTQALEKGQDISDADRVSMEKARESACKKP